MTSFLLIGIGLLAGVLSGMFGIGGGVVMVPALVWLTGLKPHAAVGTSLGALLLPVGLLGALEFYRRGQVVIAYSALLAVGLFVGAYFGAKLVGPISSLTLQRLFGAFVILMGLKLVLGK